MGDGTVALVGWIIGLAAFLGGLALRMDLGVPRADLLSKGLLVMAFLACPMIWRDGPFGITRGQRISLGLAMVLALPLVFLQPA
jgi:hypothetical protein